ncbi:MAG TPA: ATP synthase F1 subunit epsilon [Rhodobacteraceae bacterium]|jgi:F-type H+-transporting ATPase subunit epsilon|nr:F0F1 ATP synthase subunit epsilon [Alphaproteobacteria bacterium]MCH9833579.1 F0F1 ATP synthase subunit epsilon [Alphaproteobacteria bacterium]HAB39638.1 ATP synthase F1 subunit epsilon [Paracoccaceae bacterium]
MQFELVSPERNLASLDAASVKVPGADGDMTVMMGHAPTITMLRPGLLRVEVNDAVQEFVVTGGFAEIGATGISVLAERAVLKDDMTQDQMDEMFDEAQDFYQRAKDIKSDGAEIIDEAEKFLADLSTMSSELGLKIK